MALRRNVRHKKVTGNTAKKHQKPPRSVITDHLTGLYNRRYFDKSLKKFISESKRDKKNFSLLMIDIDKFKTINDRYGHLVGDKVLTELARVLKDSVRKIDICFRYGGDEIAVILPHAKKQAAENIIKRLKDIVEKYKFTIEGVYTLQLKLSIGLAVFPDDGQNPEVLIKKADDLLYKAKRQKAKPVEPFILKTKLTPPVLKEKVIFRSLLISFLKKNLNKKLILICADAGYGKTTLLAQFCSTFEKPFMFYDLEPSDNDLATFFTYITAGIQRHYSHFGQRTKTIIPQTRDIEIIVGTLINEFVEKVKDDFYIILDDYHCLQQNKEIGNALDYLLRHLPDNLHLIIASRSIPPLNLTFYQAKQGLFQLDKNQLQFNYREIQSLMRDAYNLRIPEQEIKRILLHSEGWITAIQLILQKIYALGEDKAKETLNGYVSSGEEVFNYFAREIFETLSKEIQEFLMKTSILERLDKNVCNHYLNSRKSDKILVYLHEEHIFITKIDNTYRYHLLFKEFLYDRLCDLYGDNEIKNLHRKLGNYFLSAKDYFFAAEHYLNIESYEKVAQILEKCAFSESNFPILSRLYGSVPTRILRKHPKVLLKKLRMLTSIGKWGEALKIAFSIIPRFKKTRNRVEKIETLRHIGFTYLCLGELQKSHHYLSRAYKLITKKDGVLKGKLLQPLSYAELSLGHYTRAEIYINEMHNLAKKLDSPELELKALQTEAYYYMMRYDYKKGAETFRLVFKHPACALYPLQLAILFRNASVAYLQLGEFEETKRLLDRALDTVKRYNVRRTIAYIMDSLGGLCYAKENYEQAIKYFDEALRLNREFDERPLELAILFRLTSTYWKTKKIKVAQQFLCRAKTFITSDTAYTLRFEYFVLEGMVKNSERSFRQAMTIAKGLDVPFLKITGLYSLGGFYLSKGNQKLARQYFSQCLQIARDEGYDYVLARIAKDEIHKLAFCLRENLEKGLVINVLKKINTDEAKALLLKTGEAPFHLEVFLFGGLELKNFQGTVMTPVWKTHKAKSIFAYLLMNKGKNSTRDELIDNFWRDKGLADGVRNLHTNLAILRKVLGKILSLNIPSDKMILYKNFGYQLNPNIRVKLDVEEFDRIWNEAEVILKTDKFRGIGLYEKALFLYRDDFCKEFYDTWCEKFRLHYRERALKAAKKSASFYFKQNNYNKSLNFYTQAIKLNPLEEENHLGVMQCFAALGDKQSVQKQYYNLAKEFKKNLNTSPSTRVKKLYQEIIQKM